MGTTVTPTEMKPCFAAFRVVRERGHSWRARADGVLCSANVPRNTTRGK
jgi:hypothetical protein